MALENAFENLSVEAKQDAMITALGALLTELNQKLEAGQAIALDSATLTALENITATVSNFPNDYATQATLASILSKIIAAPATEAKQDTLIAKDFATQTTLAAILAKIIASPATEATLAAMSAKIPALGQATSANSLPFVMASDQTPIPATLPVVTASGTITTINSVPGGAATAGSAVEITLAGAMGLAIQTTGTYTGALSLQVTLDGTNWITIGGTPLINLNTGGYLATITSALQGVFQAEVGGFLKARITALAAVTGTATINLRAIQNTAMVALDASIPTGANVIGAVTQSGTWNIGTITSQTPVTPTVTNGTINSAASVNATLIKNAAGTLWSIVISNINASARFVKLYNLNVAPTVGTSTPVLTIPVPTNGVVQVDGGANGIRFSTGISLAITGAAADSDTTVVTANDTKVLINYT